MALTTGIYSWSQTASSNDVADSTINWAEGQAPSSVNNSARAEMAILAKWRDDMSGAQPSNVQQTVGGSQNALTLTTNLSTNSTFGNGWTVTFAIGAGLNNTGSCTLNVDSTGAKQLRGVTGSALASGALQVGGVYTATYYQPLDQWILHGYFGTASTIGGPGSSTDKAIATWNGTSGLTLQSAGALVDGSGNITPTSNNNSSLGTATTSWANAYIASGGTFNFNNGNVTVTHSSGVLTQTGAYKAGSLYDNTFRVGEVLLTSGSASGATLNINLSSYSSYRGFKIYAYSFIPAVSAADLWLRFSTNAGVSYLATNYNWVSSRAANNGSALVFKNATNVGQIVIGDGGGTTGGYDAQITMLNPGNAATYTRTIHQSSACDNSGNIQTEAGSGCQATAQATNAIQLLFATGNITSGNYAVYGMN